MKRMHILRRPIAVADIDAMLGDDYALTTPRKGQRAALRQWRQLKHQLG